MKKTAKKKLVLAKETVRHLELGHVKGGTQTTGCTESCGCTATYGPATGCGSILQEVNPLGSFDC